jgi:hypothetical protein
MHVGVRSSNDIYDPSGRWVGNTGCAENCRRKVVTLVPPKYNFSYNNSALIRI